MTIINQSSAAMQLSVKCDDGSSYDTEIPVGGSWSAPANVIAVVVA